MAEKHPAHEETPKAPKAAKMPADAKAYAEMFLRGGETVDAVSMDAEGKPVKPCPAATTSMGRQFVMDGAGFAITHGLPPGMIGKLRYATGDPMALPADDKRGIPADHVLEA